jgi:hypothetical protein
VSARHNRASVGVPVAVLIPASPVAESDVYAALAEMKNFRKARSLKGLSIREVVEDGRCF